jgi:hypothetical protein
MSRIVRRFTEHTATSPLHFKRRFSAPLGGEGQVS